MELDQHRSYFFYLFIFLRRPLKFLFRRFAEGEGDNTNGRHDFRVHLRTVPTVVTLTIRSAHFEILGVPSGGAY